MNYSTFNSDYCIYRLNQASNAYVLVAEQFAKIVRQYVTEYQSLASVPANIRIKGILTNKPDAKKIDPSCRLADVEINKLDFDIN